MQPDYLGQQPAVVVIYSRHDEMAHGHGPFHSDINRGDASGY